MSSFNCPQCGKPILDSSRGYITECEHYPLAERNILSPNMKGRINHEKINKIKKCKECQFENGEHSFECSKYVETEWEAIKEAIIKATEKSNQDMRDMVEPEKPEWEKEWDKWWMSKWQKRDIENCNIKYDFIGNSWEIKDFIRNLLAQREAEIKFELMEWAEKYEPKDFTNIDLGVEFDKPLLVSWCSFCGKRLRAVKRI